MGSVLWERQSGYSGGDGDANCDGDAKSDGDGDDGGDDNSDVDRESDIGPGESAVRRRPKWWWVTLSNTH